MNSEDDSRPGRYQSRAGPSHYQKESFEDEEEDEHYARFDLYPNSAGDDVSTDDAITLLLSSLRFESHRQQVPTDRDDDALRRIHEKIFTQITREPDDAKRRRLKKALPASNCVREQVFYLRRRPAAPSPSYFHRLSAQLDAIVKDSFEEEYRKVAIILGLVEALAEVLILELATFGVPQVNCDEHRTIRKLIANALTNLTYGQIHSKRRLCSYDGFVRCMIRIILESTNLTQVYAGLVRNLSWMADPEMSEALRPTVHALAIAAVRANKNREEGCIKATLSALWNLASHSVDNKRTICDTPNCLAVLANLLSNDVRQTAIVDSATGILKYVSQYLATTSTHLELRPILLTRLISLLSSSSFTIVTNTLGAIANLISKDPHLQNALRHDMNAVQHLNNLRHSARDDIRAAVKTVLNAVNQPNVASISSSSSRYPPAEMTSSLTSSPRILPLRATIASPGRFATNGMDPRSCSLPRHFGGAQNVQQHYQQPLPQSEQHQINEINDDMIEIQSETAMGTRSNSVRSLGSVDPGSVMNTGGWNSTIDTAANSSRALSPVSFSDLPASPTMCGTTATVTPQVFSEQPTPVFNQVLMAQPMTYTAGSANTVLSSGQNTINNTMTTSLAGPSANNIDTNLDSPDDVLPGPSFEGDYAIIQNSDLLTRSIQAEMPAAKVSPRLNGFFSPTSSNRSQASPHLLMESIMSEMPGGSKNVEADHRESEIHSHHHLTRSDSEPHGDSKIGAKIGSQSLESQEYTSSEEEEEEDEDFQMPRYAQSETRMMIDSSIPVDCYEEEEEEEEEGDETDFEDDLNATHFEGDVTIDCREFRETSTPKGSSTQLLRKTRLPVPKTNGMMMKKSPSPQFVSKIARPRLPPKPKTLMSSKLSKDCSFYAEDDGEKDQTIYVNAPVSAQNQEIYENMRKNTQTSNAEKQMLVTTV